jgi:dGTPase
MHMNRAKLEKQENQTLAPYAVHSKDSKGRKHSEDEHDYRTCFQRDRDRILHTSAFRRLEYKTQVFINHEGDYYRTRLTHTLEVAQIGRTIARALAANEDLVEAICLAHDIGHPPFGHSGETTLASLMLDHGGFDHNKQTLRIVTLLENRFPEFDGLNLTWEVLEGIVKHETEYDKSDAEGFNPKLRGHLEAQITNVADELAYTAHDLDDGLRSGMIIPAQLDGLDLWEIVLDDLAIRDKQFNDLTRHQVIRRMIGMMVTDQIESTEERISENDLHSLMELQKMRTNLVGFSEQMQNRNMQLKDFLYTNLYRHFRVMRMQTKAEMIVTKMFAAYIAEPMMMPENIQQAIKKYGLERATCDYLSGMTDRFAIEEYQKVFDPQFLP